MYVCVLTVRWVLSYYVRACLCAAGAVYADYKGTPEYICMPSRSRSKSLQIVEGQTKYGVLTIKLMPRSRV